MIINTKIPPRKKRQITPGRLRKMASKAALLLRARKLGLDGLSIRCSTKRLYEWLEEEQRRRSRNP